MENNAVKKDNRKALPKYLLILFGAGICGGVAGFAAGWLGHENLSETIAAAVDSALTAAAPWALLCTSAQLVLDMFFFAAAQGSPSKTALLSVLFFLVSAFVLVFSQQKIVDLTRQMNPEKQGSVYDTKFRKKWLESCDEAEQKQIGQAACQAFNAVNVLCPALWVVLLMLSFAFSFDLLLPAFTVCLIWLVLNVSYCLACIRLGKRRS